MNIIMGIIIIGIGLLNTFVPEAMLELQDMFRIRGKREYTEFAVGMTRFGGIVAIIIGLVMVFAFNWL